MGVMLFPSVRERRYHGVPKPIPWAALLIFHIVWAPSCWVIIESFLVPYSNGRCSQTTSHREEWPPIPRHTVSLCQQRKQARRWNGNYKHASNKLKDVPKSKKLLFNLTANGVTKTLEKKRMETLQHVLTKAMIWKLFCQDYPDLEIERDIGDPDYLPDVVGTITTCQNSNTTEEIVFWGESGRMKVRKALDLMQRYPTTHIVHCRWSIDLDAFVQPFLDYLEKELNQTDTSWWKGRFEFAALPLEVWEFVDEDTGNITIERGDLEWKQLDLSLLQLNGTKAAENVGTTKVEETIIATRGGATYSQNQEQRISDQGDAKWIQLDQSMVDFHASEVASGRDFFGKANPTSNTEVISFREKDFIGRHIGENNAGMDANYLPKNGDMVFESVSPILSEEECSFVIQEARDTIARGLLVEEQEGDANVHACDISNSQLGEARLSNMPKTRDWLTETLPTRFYPLLNSRFGVHIDNLVLYDGLVIGNKAPTRSQPIHRDASLLTLNVALSAPEVDYLGGGTYLEALGEVLTIPKGHLLCHAGSAMHAGNSISQGERWVLVLFLLGADQPQMARRCHAQAIRHLQNGNLQDASVALGVGLNSIAPHSDHLLHATKGRMHISRGDPPSLALECFRKADEAYPICQNALVSMASLLKEQKRPRAALRRLNTVLERIQNRDLEDSQAQMSLKALAYGARRDAALCALLCSDYLYRKLSEQHPEKNNTSWASWSLQHLPAAIERLNTCLDAASNEPTLLGMLKRAEFLYTSAVTMEKENIESNSSESSSALSSVWY